MVPLDLPVWSAIPFVALLLCIAFLPLLAPHWWHSNRNKALIAAAAALPIAGYLATVHLLTGQKRSCPWPTRSASISPLSSFSAHFTLCPVGSSSPATCVRPL